MGSAKHSEIGASSAERWWNCPGSRALARLAGPQFTGVYAAEGTAAHKLREVCLGDGSDAADHLGRSIIVPPAWEGDHGFEFVVDDDMASAVQVHLDRVRRILEEHPDAEVSHELGLDLANLHPDAFGTGDTIIYIPSEQWLIVDDYKHGAGVIKKAENNPQLLYYAAGAMRRFHNRGLKKITLCIVQPRGRNGHPVDEHTFPALDLLDWRADLKDAMLRTDDPKAPRVVGEYCRFCPGAAICSDYRDEANKAASVDFSGSEPSPPKLEDMTLDQLGTLLGRADFFMGWGSAIKEFAHNEAMRGRVATGHKLVAKRSNRKWRDEDEVVSFLTGETAITAGGEEVRVPLGVALSKKSLFSQKLKSPAQIDKILGKANAKFVALLTVKPDNGYSLVPVSDERPEKTSSAEEDFAPAG